MILGIDPGVANLGWAVISEKFKVQSLKLEEYGVVETTAKMEAAERLKMIDEKIESLIKKYEIDRVAVEGLYFAKNAKSAIMVAEVIGVIKIGAIRKGIKVKEYTPLQIKMALTGYGRAEKFQVEAMIKNLLGLEKTISPSHAADAAAVALTDIMSCDFEPKGED